MRTKGAKDLSVASEMMGPVSWLIVSGLSVTGKRKTKNVCLYITAFEMPLGVLLDSVSVVWL